MKHQARKTTTGDEVYRSLEHRRDSRLGVVDVRVALEGHLPEHLRQPLFRLLGLCGDRTKEGVRSPKLENLLLHVVGGI